jgi:hypothetical protein
VTSTVASFVPSMLKVIRPAPVVGVTVAVTGACLPTVRSVSVATSSVTEPIPPPPTVITSGALVPFVPPSKLV